MPHRPLQRSQLSRSITPALFASLLAATPLLASPSALAQSAASEQARGYAIPAGNLDQALNRFASEAGILLSVDSRLTAGKSSPGLSGSYTVNDGLAHLLAGTGLRATRAQGNYALELAPERSSALELDGINVSSSGLSDTTEGSGSYTTGQMQTATKLPLSLRETPQSVTVITRQRMDDEGMTTIEDAVRSTPGLFVDNSGGVARTSFTSRGFAVSTLMYDGFPTSVLTYMPNATANLAMYDRVEVVRGATGLTQGAGNPSAAINLVYKRPTPVFQGTVSASAGSWDDYGITADVGGPLNDAGTLRGRVVTTYQDAQNFRDAVEEDHNLFYATGEADLSANTTLTLRAYRQKNHTNFFWGGLPLAADGGHLHVPRDTFLGNDWEYLDDRTVGVSGNLEHRFDNGWMLRVAALHADTDDDALASSIWNSRRYLWAQTMEQEENGLDVFASGPFQLLGREHELVVGASKRRLEYTLGDFGGGYLPGTVDPYNWNPRGNPKPALAVSSASSTDVTTQDSAYVTTRLNLADPLKLILGGRLDWYDYDEDDGDAGDYKVVRNVTRYAGLIYELDQHHSVYASYTDIFQPQTAKDINRQVIEPIVGENYEIGLKGEYFDGALNASIALFQIDQTNRAVALDDQSGCPTYPSESCSEASGLVRSKGIELEVQGALTPNWQMGAGYTFVDATYKKDADPTVEGTRFDTYSPKQMFKLSTLYTLPGELNRWRVGGNVYQQSRIYNEAKTNEQRAYAIADLVLGYQATRQLDLQLNVNNLFDKTYYRSIATSTWGPYDIYGDPRNVKLTARYSF
ncbi:MULTISPECIES: TonB-dependent siderophore receptor [Pseudomonas]|uniref:TonB-dependent siderophore receptor n=1 Tax=Pseudomonas TaxID=286 RepID=UPI00257D64F8|nr:MULTISPECIES: TonB-dependent receptor [Pseudomonas]